MAKSDKNIVRDILIAQFGYAQGEAVPEPSAEAIKILSDYGQKRWVEGIDERFNYSED